MVVLPSLGTATECSHQLLLVFCSPQVWQNTDTVVSTRNVQLLGVQSQAVQIAGKELQDDGLICPAHSYMHFSVQFGKRPQTLKPGTDSVA